MKTLLALIGAAIIIALFAYWRHLVGKIKAKEASQRAAQHARFNTILDSLDVIARAMAVDQCNHSEGVLRIKPLLDVLGKPFAQNYPAMAALYDVVADMPILAERKELKRNERMRLDLMREAAEAEQEAAIKAEIPAFLADLATMRKEYV